MLTLEEYVRDEHPIIHGEKWIKFRDIRRKNKQ